MSRKPNYRKTLVACYFGFITQAIAANFAPLLFLTFRSTYGIALDRVALIPTVFFFTQLLTDLASAKFVDKIGYRKCAVAAEVLSTAGLAGLAFLPDLLPVPFAGILFAVILYAIGSGLIEVLGSPIVEACPFENKEGTMSLLHSFYCWGSVLVILGSTLFFAVAGVENWRILACLLALVPLANAYNFAVCPIAPLVPEGDSMGIRGLFRLPVFWLLALLMVCSGAAELSMAQWASAFTESALGISKTVGDLAGPCLFAVLMGISRVCYGKYSERLDMVKCMFGCGLLCVACYLLAALSPLPVFGLAGCALCGISVGIMWPGTISISAQVCPKGGTALFALLALAGDLGGTAGPLAVGMFSELAGDNLKMGIFSAVVFPVVLLAGLGILRAGKYAAAGSRENPEG